MRSCVASDGACNRLPVKSARFAYLRFHRSVGRTSRLRALVSPHLVRLLLGASPRASQTRSAMLWSRIGVLAHLLLGLAASQPSCAGYGKGPDEAEGDGSHALRANPPGNGSEQQRAASQQRGVLNRGEASAQELGDGAQAGLGLLIETVPGQIPFDTNQQQLVAHIVPIASWPRGVISPAQFGHVLQSAAGGQRFGHPALKRPVNDGEICPPAQFGRLSRGRHLRTRRFAPALGNHFLAVFPTIHRFS
jgi:hypothetical protein